MDVHLRNFRIFVEVYRENSFSGAARILKIAQPTVSQQIASLENYFNVQLFSRVGHRIVATEAGQEIFSFASNFLEQADDFMEKFKTDRQSLRGPVRCAMSESFQWNEFFKRVLHDMVNFPEIQFDLNVMVKEDIILGLLEGRLDIGFVAGEILSPDIRLSRFTSERYAAVSTRKDFFDPLKKGIASQPLRLICYPGWEEFFMTWAKTHGIWKFVKTEFDRPAIRVSSLTGALQALKAGAGMGVFPAQCVADELSSGELIEYSPSRQQATRPIFMTLRAQAKPARRIQVIIDHLRAARK